MPQGLILLLWVAVGFTFLTAVISFVNLYREWRSLKLAGRRVRSISIMGGIMAGLTIALMLAVWDFAGQIPLQ